MKEAWQQHDVELDQLFSAYRDACPAPEAQHDFMSRLWARIDSRPSWLGQLWRWSNGMVLAAAAASLFFVMLQMLPRGSSDFYGTTYLETLADQRDFDDLGDVAMIKVHSPAEQPAADQESPSR